MLELVQHLRLGFHRDSIATCNAAVGRGSPRTRVHGRWEFKRSFIGHQEHIVHDVSLGDKIGHRVRCYTKETLIGAPWIDPVWIHDAADGDLWGTEVSLKDLLPRDCYGSFVSIGRRAKFTHQGLRLQRIQNRDEFALKANIPKLEAIQMRSISAWSPVSYR